MREEEYKLLFRFNLQLFAEEGPGGEKTEEPTAKKLKDARKEGQVAKSREIVTAANLLGLFLGVKIFAGYMGNRFLSSFNKYYSSLDVYAKDELSIGIATSFLKEGMLDIIIIAFPLMIIAFAIAFGMNVAQVKLEITAKPLKPKFSKLNPIKGFKNIISKDKLFELVKDVIKIFLIFYLTISSLKSDADKIVILYDLGLMQAIIMIGDIIINIGIKISGVYFVVGLVDFIYRKIKHKKDLRMTKQEVKDEYKNQEGDPQIKGKRMQKMREASRRRMMQSVPEADVVITNPTHFACAVKYDKESSKAPVLVAKGADYMAQKIKEIAKESDVPIVENKPLARMLYYNVEIDSEIPEELYQMTAEVLAYVYRLKNKF